MEQEDVNSSEERIALPLDPEVALKALLAVDPEADDDADDQPEG